MNPLKLQNGFCGFSESKWPERLTAVEDMKLTAIHMSLMARPLIKISHGEPPETRWANYRISWCRNVLTDLNSRKLNMIHPAPITDNNDTTRITALRVRISFTDAGADSTSFSETPIMKSVIEDEEEINHRCLSPKYCVKSFHIIFKTTSYHLPPIQRYTMKN